MTSDTLDRISRAAGADRRRALLAFGAAGLATTMGGTFGARAKQSAGQKAKKKCKKQQAACREEVVTLCTSTKIVEQCKTSVLPCCDVCDVSVAVTCAFNAFVLLD